MSTPSDYVETRTVRIYRRSTDPALQHGTKPNYTWEIDFDSNEGWEIILCTLYNIILYILVKWFLNLYNLVETFNSHFKLFSFLSCA